MILLQVAPSTFRLCCTTRLRSVVQRALPPAWGVSSDDNSTIGWHSSTKDCHEQVAIRQNWMSTG
eukprot:4075094-Amphidinium_carterae.1